MQQFFKYSLLYILAYDMDDPLADLLSDNDSIKVSKKLVAVKKTKKNKEGADQDIDSSLCRLCL